MQEKDSRNIVLTGFMGTGKTTVGLLVADQLGREFVDTDDLIQERQGKSIAEIFTSHGEAAFRSMEADIARELGRRERLVISTGGKLMLDPANIEALAATGRIFCLTAPLEEIVLRVNKDKAHNRPLLSVPNPDKRIAELLRERRTGYNRFQKIITSNKTPRQIAGELCESYYDVPKRFNVDHSVGSCQVVLGCGILPSVRQLASIAGKMAVITDRAVKTLYAPICLGVDHVIELSDGDKQKSAATVTSICDRLFAAGFDQSGSIMALGGSSVGDVAGCVAATYMDGVNLIQCPTSVRAIVTAGLKVSRSIDRSQGLDLVGVCRQPSSVIADLATLQTLPSASFAEGMAEVVRLGLIAEPELLISLGRCKWSHGDGILSTSLAKLKLLLGHVLQVKTSILREEASPHGRGCLLGLGHEFVHAIEEVSRYQISHGEALAMGMVAVANLSYRMGCCDKDMQPGIESLLQGIGLPTRIPALDPALLLGKIDIARRSQQSEGCFILLAKPGKVVVAKVERSSLMATLTEMTSPI